MKSQIYKKLYFAGLIAGLLGLFFGWLIFGTNENETHLRIQNHEHTQKNAWTCSMHPQINQEEPGKCPICGMDLIPVEIDKNAENPYQIQLNERDYQLANIRTQKVQYGQAVKEVLLNGKIKADESRIFNQTIHFPGRIEKLFVSFAGEKIHKGQKIADIYSPELVKAQAELIEAVKYKDTDPSLLKASRKKLKLWKMSDQQINELEQHKKVTEVFPVYAEVSGFILKKMVNAGDYLKSGTVLFDVVDLSSVWVVFDAYDADIPFLKVGDEVKISRSNQDNKVYKTRISYIDPIINSNTRSLSIRCDISNSNLILKPGMFVSGKVKSKLASEKKWLIIPKSAVLWTGERSIIYVKIKEKQIPAFEMRKISLGINLGEQYTVNSGLSEGEEIVVNGTFSVDAAAQLNHKYSMMNQPGTTEKAIILSDELSDQLKNIISEYLILKDHLVQGDSTEARNSVNSIYELFTNESTLKIPKTLYPNFVKIKKVIESLKGSTNISEQRKWFKYLSESFIKIVKSARLDYAVLYLQHCPMADDYKGAYWLSTESEIINPYFGDEMLSCGDVKEVIYRQ